jgi:hypothetical protein
MLNGARKYRSRRTFQFHKLESHLRPGLGYQYRVAENDYNVYSQGLNLSKDTLPALSGIANRLRNGGRYYAGMWEKILEQNLLWYSLVMEKRWPSLPKSYIAPSFAWPSVIGDKSFLDCSSLNARFKIVDVNCMATGDNPLGELKKGYIKLEAASLKAKFVNGFNESLPISVFLTKNRHGYVPYATLVCKKIGHHIFHPDTVDVMEMIAGTDMWCLQLFDQRVPNSFSFGLVLQQLRSDEGSFLSKSPRYVRVGVFGSIRSSSFTNTQTETFDIR